jgi:hypothetical protein
MAQRIQRALPYWFSREEQTAREIAKTRIHLIGKGAHGTPWTRADVRTLEAARDDLFVSLAF